MRSFLFAFAAAVLFGGAHGVVRISCIGDSITLGGSTDCASSDNVSYPAYLQQFLGSDFVVTNFGDSGKTMLTNGLCGPPAAGNCSYVSTATWPAALASNPDIVTIALGTNDAKVRLSCLLCARFG